ncbi:hypothetical protein QBC38DRAFT_107048 [Podospora fimiseda]|uniref:Heterokaryon incompatibility domain-containing protein n=1 Tax=Podospora fimiseda TaxID=252190 RepID=A0AAN7BDR9_9PEZI|nr:hypothetical protein QBC38DRAFT_107048 [Podospora fimiseda]
MDHLPLPRDPLHPNPSIPLSSKQFQIPSGQFLSYPLQFSHLITGSHPHVPNQRDVLIKPDSAEAAVSSDDILDYYQGWLFFSLLSEFIGEKHDARKYLQVIMNDDKEIEKILLTTEYLWDDLSTSDGIVEGSDRHQHLEKCLDVALEAFDDLERNFSGFGSIFTDEVLCLASLCETLDSFLCTTVDKERIFPCQAERNWLSKVVDIIQFDKEEMVVKGGWCPGDIMRVKETFNSVAAFYYWRSYRVANEGKHRDCPDWGCTLRSEAKTTHVGGDKECDCPGMVEFEEKDLIEIYERGELPVFTIGKMEDGSLGIALKGVGLTEEAQKDPENRYVALSHVWSEGMGNVRGNGLPFCRLSVTQYWAMLALQCVMKGESTERGDSQGKGIEIERKPETMAINLWIDTMCCPATPGYGKNLCLARMREIYANAEAVLVRSMALEDMEIGKYVEGPEKGVMDVAARLYTSPWMKRMWTLQEGVLAGMNHSETAIGGRLVLGFGGAVLSLESVVGLLKQAPVHEAALAFDMIGKFAELTPLLYDDKNSGIKGSFLTVLSTALKYRSVSVASDELICLATLLGVRVGKAEGELPLIGSAEEGSENTFDEGMRELWKRIGSHDGGIPAEIIFSSVPRIRIDGFRWAPRTFIQHAKYGQVFLMSSSDDEQTKITEKGLQVTFPGFKLKVDLELHGTPLVVKSGNAPKSRAHRVMFMQLPTGGEEDWYAIHIHQLDQDDLADRLDQLSLGPTLLEQVGDGNLCLIQKNEEPVGRCLLVSIRDETSSSIQVRSKYPVTVGPVNPSTGYICSKVQQNLCQLRDAVTAAGDAAKEEVLEKKLNELLSKDETGLLREALVLEALGKENVSASDEQVMETFVKVANLVAELGGVQGTAIAEDQTWIVD